MLVGWWLPRSSLTVVLHWRCWRCSVAVFLLQPWSRWPWLHSWYTLQASLSCPKRLTVFNVALSAWVACGSLHDRIVNYVMHPESPESTCLTELTVSLCSYRLSVFTLFWRETCPTRAWTTVLPDCCLAKIADKSPIPEVSVDAFLWSWLWQRRWCLRLAWPGCGTGTQLRWLCVTFFSFIISGQCST